MKAIELSEKIKLGLSAVYSLSGSDGYLRDLATGVLIRTLPEETRELNYLRMEGDCNVDEILSGAQTVAFGATHRIDEVRGMNRTLNEAEKRAMLAYAQEPNDDCVLILSDCGKTFDCISKWVVHVDCERMTRDELCAQLSKRFAARGYRATPKAIRDVADCCACDLGKSLHECDKLMLYCVDDKSIDEQDVARLTPPDAEMKIFELTNAMQRGEFDRALEVTDLLLGRGEKPAYILATVTAAYRRMFHIATSGADDATLCKTLGLSAGALAVNRRIVQTNRRSVQGYIVKLKSTVDYLYELEYGFKNGIYTPDTALQLALVKIMTVGKGA